MRSAARPTAFEVIHTINVGAAPHGIRFSADGDTAYVALSGDGQIAVVDLERMEVVARWEAGTTPLDLVATNDGRWIVTQFRDSTLITPEPTTLLAQVGAGPSLFTPEAARGRTYLVSEFADRLTALDTATGAVVATYPTGRRPYPADVTPDGVLAFVPNLTDGTVSIIDLLKNLMRAIDPDYVLTEIPPNRFDAAMASFQATDSITEAHVRRFPEYVDVLFPLTKQMNFEIIPTADWTQPTADFRSARLQAISRDPDRAAEWATYQRANARADSAIAAGGEPDDPRWIHTDAYDAAYQLRLGVYNAPFNDELGPGGWETINAAHYAHIARVLDAHRGEGKRFLITYGAGHKGWFLRQLCQREDITLLAVAPFLDQLP